MEGEDSFLVLVKGVPPLCLQDMHIELSIDDVAGKGNGFLSTLRSYLGVQPNQSFTIHRLHQQEGKQDTYPILTIDRLMGIADRFFKFQEGDKLPKNDAGDITVFVQLGKCAAGSPLAPCRLVAPTMDSTVKSTWSCSIPSRQLLMLS